MCVFVRANSVFSSNRKVRCDWWKRTSRRSISSERCKPLSALWAYQVNKRRACEAQKYAVFTNMLHLAARQLEETGGPFGPGRVAKAPLLLLAPPCPPLTILHNSSSLRPIHPPSRPPPASLQPPSPSPPPPYKIHYNGANGTRWARGP